MNNNNQPPPWSEAPPWAKYRAQNKNGNWLWFQTKPSIAREVEWTFGTRQEFALVIYELNPNWRYTLQKRPENE